MSPHAAAHELHDYVYGFLAPERRDGLRAHLAECADCRGAAERLQGERSALAGALAEPESPDDGDIADLKRKLRRLAAPRRSAAPSWARWFPAAAAAVVLGALGVWTFRGEKPDVAGTLPLQQSNDPVPRKLGVDRFLALAERGKGIEAELAMLALQSSGPAGIEALHSLLERRPELKKRVPGAKTHGRDEASKDVLEKLKSIRVDMAFAGSEVSDILSYVRDFSGLNILLDAKLAEVGTLQIDLNVKNEPLAGVLDRVAKKAKCAWFVQDGIVTLADAGLPMMNEALLRLPAWPAQRKSAEQAFARLGSEKVADRDAAAQELVRMGTAAEETLWNGLEAKDAQVRKQCEELLRRLYTPVAASAASAPSAAFQKILDTPVDFDGMNCAFSSILRSLDLDMNWVICGDSSSTFSIKVRRLTVAGLLKISLPNKGLEGVPVGDVLFVVPKERVAPAPTGPGAWVPIDTAGDLQKSLDDLAAGRDADLVRFGPAALYALEAMTAGRPELKDRALKLRATLSRTYLLPHGPRPTSTVTDARLKAALAWKGSLQLEDQPASPGLKELARRAGLPIRIDAAEEEPAISLSLTDQPLETILEATAFASGLSLRVEDGTVVLAPAK